MKIQLTKLVLPIYWQSYIEHGDESGLENGEKRLIDTYLASNSVDATQCVDIARETSVGVCADGLFTGEYTTYTFDPES
jgi:hypothetical protein